MTKDELGQLVLATVGKRSEISTAGLVEETGDKVVIGVETEDGAEYFIEIQDA